MNGWAIFSKAAFLLRRLLPLRATRCPANGHAGNVPSIVRSFSVVQFLKSPHLQGKLGKQLLHRPFVMSGYAFENATQRAAFDGVVLGHNFMMFPFVCVVTRIPQAAAYGKFGRIRATRSNSLTADLRFSRPNGDWQAARTRRLESLRYVITGIALMAWPDGTATQPLPVLRA